MDPGREKCGTAVCEPGAVLARRVIRPEDLAAVASRWVAAFNVERIIVGNRTGSRAAYEVLEDLRVPVVVVEEQGTTLAARGRYFRDHPPRGWRRLIPLSMQVPPEPYDDYAAVVLAEAYLGTDA